MPRNFGIRLSADEFWNEPTPEEREPLWPWLVIGAGIALALLVAMFV